MGVLINQALAVLRRSPDHTHRRVLDQGRHLRFGIVEGVGRGVVDEDLLDAARSPDWLRRAN